MIYIRLSGRFGNYLFQIAAGASLAKQWGADFKVVVAPDDESIAANGDDRMWNYVQRFKDTIFHEIDFIREAPEGIRMYSWRDYPYKPIPYNAGEDLLIDGYFQSYKYIDETLVRQLYAIPASVEASLLQKYGRWLQCPFCCIHVRRGDYLKIPQRFSICSVVFFREAMKRIGSDMPFIVISDDIPWCKRHLKGKYIYYADQSTSMLEDFYLQSLATHNIISNSSFSWWGAWLNPHPYKRVLYPIPWFGPHLSHYDTSDLWPASWESVTNRTPLRYRIKANWIRLRMKIEREFLRR